jgi:hypothetical protein
MSDETITPLRTLEQKELDERQRQCVELLEELLKQKLFESAEVE